MRISIIGLGWYGLPLARALSDHHEISGSKTSVEEAAALRRKGLSAFALSLNPEWTADEVAESKLREADAVVINIPPPRGNENPEEFYAIGMRELEKRISAGNATHVVFVSSTGVFGAGQHHCDEDTEPQPDRTAGRVLFEAEQLFRSSFRGKFSVIRPGGLVGSDRFPGRFMAGRTGLSGKKHPVNLVHRDDLIALTRAILEKDFERTVFHAVAKDHPSKQDFYQKAAALLNLERPEFDPGDESQGKFISAEKSKTAAGVRFKYDDPYDMLTA